MRGNLSKHFPSKIIQKAAACFGSFFTDNYKLKLKINKLLNIIQLSVTTVQQDGK